MAFILFGNFAQIFSKKKKKTCESAVRTSYIKINTLQVENLLYYNIDRYIDE